MKISKIAAAGVIAVSLGALASSSLRCRSES